MKTVIAFDMYGPIIKEARQIVNMVFPMLSERGIEVDLDELKIKIHSLNAGKISRKDFWTPYLKEFEEFERDYLDKNVLREGIIEVLNYLNPNYSLGIISNSPVLWAEYLLEKFQLKPFFEKIVISEAVKSAKPDKLIFEEFLKAFPKNKELYFIDDRLNYFPKAKECGFKTIWLALREPNSDFVPDITIHSLSELKKYF